MNKKNITILKIAIIIFIAAVFLVLFNYTRAINSPADKNGQAKTFVINSGEGVKQVSANLTQEGLIRSKFFFEVYVWQKGLESQIKAGAHEISPAMPTKEIVASLVNKAKRTDEADIKIIEGWNISDIAKYLKENNLPAGNDFANKANGGKGNFYGSFEFLSDKPSKYGLEGYLFPDTYRIYNNDSSDEIIKRMLSNFDKKLTDEMRAEIKKQNKTIFDVVTMASLIEKEVKTEDDMKIVSGIFWNRIKDGQALQSCATLAYALGEDKKQYSFEDTRFESPYNTYINRGLPPTPICNPSLKALRAAIYPTDTNYNYFLSTDDGKTIFSKTYDEHLINKGKYLK